MNFLNSSDFIALAEAVGEALGRGVARGINAGVSGRGGNAPVAGVRRGPGRPPKARLEAGAVPAERRCKVSGCQNPARSKGLCSKHYQAERRRLQGKA